MSRTRTTCNGFRGTQTEILNITKQTSIITPQQACVIMVSYVIIVFVGICLFLLQKLLHLHYSLVDKTVDNCNSLIQNKDIQILHITEIPNNCDGRDDSKPSTLGCANHERLRVKLGLIACGDYRDLTPNGRH